MLSSSERSIRDSRIRINPANRLKWRSNSVCEKIWIYSLFVLKFSFLHKMKTTHTNRHLLHVLTSLICINFFVWKDFLVSSHLSLVFFHLLDVLPANTDEYERNRKDKEKKQVRLKDETTVNVRLWGLKNDAGTLRDCSRKTWDTGRKRVEQLIWNQQEQTTSAAPGDR